jgi:hypothetical protein
LVVYFTGKYDVEGNAIVETEESVETYSETQTSEWSRIYENKEHSECLANLEKKIIENRKWFDKKWPQLEEKTSSFEDPDGDVDGEIPF